MACIYSRSSLLAIRSAWRSRPLASSLWRKVTSLGLSRDKPTRRGYRAGCGKQQSIAVVMGFRGQNVGMLFPHFTSTSESSTYELAELANGTLNMQSSTSTGLNIQNDTSQSKQRYCCGTNSNSTSNFLLCWQECFYTLLGWFLT